MLELFRILATVVVLLSPNADGPRDVEQYWTNTSWPTFEACEEARNGDGIKKLTAELWLDETAEHVPLTVLEPTTECAVQPE